MGPRLSDHSDHSQPLGRKEQQNHRLDRWENTGEREDGLRFGGLGYAGITQLLPQMPEQRWRKEELVKRKYRPRPKGICEETRYTERRRSDYPISIVGNRTPQSLAALIDTIVLINQSI